MVLALGVLHASAQVTLQADGQGDAYQLLSSVLGGTPYEVPDCSHPEFGPHITETWDSTLGEYVFVFHIHVTPDNDRCVNFDRQRNEIKTYGPSPSYLKGFYGDLCNYRWKFKLDAGFQPSPNFTHIHQIKAGDGSDSGSPIITITPRYGNPERLEIIYTAPSGFGGSGTLTTAPLAGFKGQWIEAFERVLYATNGTYELTLRRVSDGAVLLSYTNNNLNLWRGDATFNRPKWGIYRSLNSSSYLRDEDVLFADFCLGKGGDYCPSDIGETRSPADLRWAASTNNSWNLTGSNWFNLDTGAMDVFVAGDNVLFDDTAGVATNIVLSGMLAPAAITNNSSSNDFIINGTGSIGGTASLVKEGSSILTLNTTNSFTGPVTIFGGTVKVGSTMALGSTNSGTFITNAGTLDINGVNVSDEPVTVSGAGIGGQGAIVNNGSQQTTALQHLILAGNTTLGGTGRWDVRGSSPSLLTGGHSFSITKVGPNQVSLVSVNPVDAALGDLDIREGSFAIQTSTAQLGDPGKAITVHSNATLNLWTLTSNPLNKQILLKNGATVFNEKGPSIIVGPVTTEGSAIFDIADNGTPPSLTMSNAISGSGGLRVTGGGNLVLAGTNTFLGDTWVTSGTLTLTGSGSINDCHLIDIAANAVLDVKTKTDGQLALNSGQTLQGDGLIDGSVVVNADATMSPGDSIGALTVAKEIQLHGITIMELNQSNGTNDVLRSSSKIDYGGSLWLTNASGTPTTNDSFKLFEAAGYSGAFANIRPAIPGIGMGWNTNTLATDGVLRISSVPTPMPIFSAVSVEGSKLNFSGNNGVPDWLYYVLVSTNLALHLDQWTPIATNVFSDSGSFTFTNQLNNGIEQQYYLLQLH